MTVAFLCVFMFRNFEQFLRRLRWIPGVSAWHEDIRQNRLISSMPRGQEPGAKDLALNLLRQGLDPNSEISGFRLIATLNTEIRELLIQYGATMDAKAIRDSLVLAATAGRVDMLEWLEPYSLKEEWLHEATVLAIDFDQVDAAKWLVYRGGRLKPGDVLRWWRIHGATRRLIIEQFSESIPDDIREALLSDEWDATPSQGEKGGQTPL